MPRIKPDGKACVVQRIELGQKERDALELTSTAIAAGSVLSGLGVAALGIGAVGFVAVSLFGTAWYVNSRLENPLSPNNAGGEAALTELGDDINTVTDKLESSLGGLTIYEKYVQVGLWRKEMREAAFALSELAEKDRVQFYDDHPVPDVLTSELVAHQVGIRITAARRRVMAQGTAGAAGWLASAVGYGLEGQDYYLKPEDAEGYEADPLLDLAAYRTVIVKGSWGARTVQLVQGSTTPGLNLEAEQKANPDPTADLDFTSGAGTSWASL